MMYLSAYPIAITIRNSNVYEERSLGIYETVQCINCDPEHAGLSEEDLITHQSRWFFFQKQLEGQVGHDVWFLLGTIVLIIWFESSSYEANPVQFSVFNTLFEVVSGYSGVGLTIGLPDRNYSYCGAWHISSKVLLCAAMLRGRHRDLPATIDRAIQLPGENPGAREEVDQNMSAVREHQD